MFLGMSDALPLNTDRAAGSALRNSCTVKAFSSDANTSEQKSERLGNLFHLTFLPYLLYHLTSFSFCVAIHNVKLESLQRFLICNLSCHKLLLNREF